MTNDSSDIGIEKVKKTTRAVYIIIIIIINYSAECICLAFSGV